MNRNSDFYWSIVVEVTELLCRYVVLREFTLYLSVSFSKSQILFFFFFLPPYFLSCRVSVLEAKIIS